MISEFYYKNTELLRISDINSDQNILRDDFRCCFSKVKPPIKSTVSTFYWHVSCIFQI